MPSASAKLEKQTSTEVVEPLKMVLTMIEHKKRNLEKRKVKLEAYKTEQKNGKELNSEQQSAVSKYDEVIQTLVFANDLVKQIQQLELDHAKMQKKQQKKDQAKEQSEKYQRDMQRTKDLIIFQDVLKSLTDEVVRSDFLEGKNGAVVVSKEDMDLLDEVSQLILPNNSATDEAVNGAAQFLVNLLDRKKKEWNSTSKSYADISALIMSLNDSDYFRNAKNIQTIPSPVEQQQEPEPEEESVTEIEDTLVDPAIIKKEISSSPSMKNNLSPTNQMPNLPEAPLMAPPAEAPYFVTQAPTAPPPHFIPQQQQPPPVHLPPRQTINDVIGQSNSAFDFLQESQIEAEQPVIIAQLPQFPPGMAPPPAAPSANAVPQPEFHQAIPSQTFTNQTFHVIGQVPQQQQQPQVHPQSTSPKSTMQPYPAPAPQPAYIEEVAQLQRPEEPKQQTVAPTSFAQAATYSSLAQKPQNFTNGPPGFPPQQQKMQTSQFQPIPTLEQEMEKESNTWNGGSGDATDDQQQRGGYRGKGGRGGRGGRGVADRNGYGNRPRQNGQGRPGGYRQDRQDGERGGSYENGVSEHKGGNFRPRGPPRDGPREHREPREPKEWKESREWQNQEPRDNSGGRRGPRPNGPYRGAGRGRGPPGSNQNPRPQQQPVKQQQ